MKIAAPLQGIALFSTLALSAVAYGQQSAPAHPTTTARSAAPTHAQPRIYQEKQGDWQVVCEDVPATKGQPSRGRICKITQQQLDPKTKKPVMLMQMASTPDRTQASIMVPLGVSLTRGLKVDIDGTSPSQLHFLTCLPGGCVAPYQIDPQKLALLRKGKKLNVAVSGLQGQSLTTGFSLNGFAKAIDRATKLTTFK